MGPLLPVWSVTGQNTLVWDMTVQILMATVKTIKLGMMALLDRAYVCRSDI